MTCELEGKCQLQNSRKYESRYKTALKFFMRECPDCNGKGEILGFPQMQKCGKCDGIGFLDKKQAKGKG